MIKSDFVRFRGKHFSGDDLAVFRRIIEENWQTSRCAISREICRQFNWRQPNGHLKEGICRTLLVRLERKNMIELPEPIRMPEPVPADIKPKPVTIDQTPIRGPVEEVKNQLSFLEVKKTPQEKVYNSLTEQFSGGYRRPIGENRKYIAFIDNRPSACIGLSAAPRYISCRDTYIGWSPETRNKNIHLIAKMNYFFTMPWVLVQELDLFLMDILLGRIRKDWKRHTDTTSR